MYLPLIAAFIAISGSLGVSYMADDSLPGDALYSVKVHVNEGVRHMAAIGSEADARVSANIIAHRAQEARQLAAEGRLDSEAKNRLSQEIESELRIWNKVTADWAGNGTSSSQTEARTMFESQVKTNADIFQLLGVSLQSSGNARADSTTTENQDIPFLQEEGTSSSTADNSPSGTADDTGNASTSLNLQAEGVIDVR